MTPVDFIRWVRECGRSLRKEQPTVSLSAPHSSLDVIQTIRQEVERRPSFAVKSWKIVCNGFAIVSEESLAYDDPLFIMGCENIDRLGGYIRLNASEDDSLFIDFEREEKGSERETEAVSLSDGGGD